ncbi:MAG: twin-arginine translocase TatA/TatE family subunit [Bryobacteraceae bacterium]|nr:twin-arginine translocase TatA/TatE family subunit [Bryobacteraceae bacterium]
MGPLGIPETIFIFVLALLIFGPKKLPELGRTIGKAMTEFRRASSELKATFDREMHAIERDSELKEVTQAYNAETYNYDSYYDSGAYGSESYDYSAQDHSTEGASATQGADAGTDGSLTGSHDALTAANSDHEANVPDVPAGDHPPAQPSSETVKS